MSIAEDETQVAEGLADAIRRAGHQLAAEPRRVQGMMIDFVGVNSRTRRAEIDAVVLAAEEGIPESMLTGQLDESDGIDLLEQRGLEQGVARFALEVWRYALGLLDDGSEPPTLVRTLESDASQSSPNPTVQREQSDGNSNWVVSDAASSVSPTQSVLLETGRSEMFASTHPQSTYSQGSDGVVDGVTHGYPPTPVSPRPVGRRWLIPAAVAAAILFVGLGGLIAWLLIGSGSETAAKPSPRAASSAKVKAPSMEFPIEETHVGDLQRVWSIDGRELQGQLSFTNDTATEKSGRFYEVVPKELASTATSISSTPKHKVIKDDPVIAWDLKVGAGKTVEVTYTIELPDGSGQDLEGWRDAWAVQAAAFETERKALPKLTITTAGSQQIAVREFDLAGTTDPTAKVAIAGANPTVNADGTWTQHVTGLAEGSNTIQVVATSEYGVVASAPFTITVATPVPTTTTVPTPRPTPRSTPAPDPTPTPEPQPPKNQAPRVNSKYSGYTVESTPWAACNAANCRFYQFTFIGDEFIDPDGDSWSLASATLVSGDGTLSTIGAESPGCARGCAQFTPTDPYATPHEFTIDWQVVDTAGNRSNTLRLYYYVG